MTVRARYQLEVGISSTTAEDRDLGNHLWETVTDTQADGGSRRTTLAAGATDVELSMCEVGVARVVALRTVAVDPNQTPEEITVKRNTVGNEAIEVGPPTGSKEGYLLLTSQTGITALFASNPGTVDMYVTVVAAGD